MSRQRLPEDPDPASGAAAGRGADSPLALDGSRGEGGGQILRSALSLSMLTGQAFRMVRIRAGRPKPGLRRQHLTAVRAAAEVSGAQVEGAELGSRELRFEPGAVRAGRYTFSTEGAGSTTLVLQTLLPPLLSASRASQLTLRGGTHNPFAPPYEFVRDAFAPQVAALGPRLALTLVRPGFFPAGGGELRAEIEPVPQLRPLRLLERGQVRRVRIQALVSALPRHIGERELATATRELQPGCESLGLEPPRGEVVEVPDPRGPGNVVLISVESERLTEVFTGFGMRGVRAETVAAGAAREAAEYLAAGVPVGRHLADQLLLPLAAAGGGVFRTLAPSTHALTNLEVLGRFLDLQSEVAEAAEGAWQIELQAA